MKFRIAVALLWAGSSCLFAADPVAVRLGREAHKAEDAGQTVRAYLLYAEAAARDPHNVSFAVSRDALKPMADMLTKFHVDDADVSADIRKAEQESVEGGQSALPVLNPDDSEKKDEQLAPPPALANITGTHSFDIRADAKALVNQIGQAFGVRIVFDPEFESTATVRFNLNDADFHTAMNAAAVATGTFMFPVSPRTVFVAKDTEIKRSEFEPQMTEVVHLPEAQDPKEIVEAANAVRGALGTRGQIAWNSTERTVLIHDRETRAKVARSLLEALLLPKGQVSLDVQFLNVDTSTLYQYGISWQTTYQILSLGLISKVEPGYFPSLANATNFLPFGGGLSLIGIGLTDANLMANYSSSNSRTFYNATLQVSDGQTATLHFGDEYPIPTATFSGATAASSYLPLGQVTQEDLGLSLKMIPHVRSDGQLMLELEAKYETLGSTFVDGIPSINQRNYKGSVSLRETQWAIIGGMQEEAHSTTRSGFPGLSQIPGLEEIFTQTSRQSSSTNTLILIKPTVTRLPVSDLISPQYLLGPAHGEQVLF